MKDVELALRAHHDQSALCVIQAILSSQTNEAEVRLAVCNEIILLGCGI